MKKMAITSRTKEPDMIGHNHLIKGGEPLVFDLDHFEGDLSLRGDAFWTCCDCGLRHHHTYEVRETIKGQEAYMVVRSYRDNYGTELVQKSRKQRRRKK